MNPELHGRSAATTLPAASSAALPPAASSAALPPAVNPVYELPPHLLLLQLMQPPDALPVPAHKAATATGPSSRTVPPTRPREHPAQRDDNRAPTDPEHPRAGTPRRPAAARCVVSITRACAKAGAASYTYAISAWAGTRYSAATTPGPGSDDSHGVEAAYPDLMHTYMHVNFFCFFVFLGLFGMQQALHP